VTSHGARIYADVFDVLSLVMTELQAAFQLRRRHPPTSKAP
jgi:hypothetical protein